MCVGKGERDRERDRRGLQLTSKFPVDGSKPTCDKCLHKEKREADHYPHTHTHTHTHTNTHHTHT